VISEVRRRCDAGDVEIVQRLAEELPTWFEVHGNTMDAALAFHMKSGAMLSEDNRRGEAIEA
jgi:hemerythrin